MNSLKFISQSKSLAQTLCIWLVLACPTPGISQEVITLSSSLFNERDEIRLAELDGWVFHKGHDPSWSSHDLNVMGWEKSKPAELTTELANAEGKIEGWYRLKFNLDGTLSNKKLGLSRDLWVATDIYINGVLIQSFGNTGTDGQPFKRYNPSGKLPVALKLETGVDYVIVMHIVNYEHELTLRELRLKPANLSNLLNLNGPDYFSVINSKIRSTFGYSATAIAMTGLLMIFFWILVLRNPKDKTFLLIAILSSLISIYGLVHFFDYLFEASDLIRITVAVIWSLIGPFIAALDVMIMEWIIKKKIPYLSKTILFIFPITSAIAHIYDQSLLFSLVNTVMLLYFSYLVISSWKSLTGELAAVIVGLVVNMVGLMTWVALHKYYYHIFIIYDDLIMVTAMLAIPLSLMVFVAFRLNNIMHEVKEKANKLVKLSDEKKLMLANQNVILEKQVSERTEELKRSLDTLKSTQSQLIQSEKMASLGELTAGIAHEIQNPLNFVNNFSEVNKELLTEMREEIEKKNFDEVSSIAKDVEENEEKINHHGKRAGDIVKGMLQHSRTSSGTKEPTDINVLADEYLRLAYHGLRAKDKSFNATMKTELDAAIGKVNVVPQDIGRVILNLITNAFYAVSEKQKACQAELAEADYVPSVTVSTKKANNKIEIRVSDNGNGIPDAIKEKIFQPFFTTKPTGQGTGLGLSLAYDIVKAHGGELKVETKHIEGLPAGAEAQAGSEFIISLPVV